MQPNIKTYLNDASANLKAIVLEAAFIRFDEWGNILLEGKFTAADLRKIMDMQAEVILKLTEMKKAEAAIEGASK